MRSYDQVAYLERMLTMVRTSTRDDGPGVSHTSVEEYYDPTRYRREVSLLFRRHPIMVAFAGQLRKAGDFVVHNDTGQPILAVRGTDGTLRAFLNVCRHRSASGDVKPCGSDKRAFTCPYHHPGTVYPLFLDNIAPYERMARHLRMAAAKRTLTELEGQPKETWRILDHAIVLYQLFPNTVLTYTQDHCGVFTSFPVSPDESVMQFSVLVSPEEKAKKPRSYWKANVQ